ncbi:MAG: hypothetical protein LBP79_04705 [Clostridiales bacterium]|jgi:hypothetical protein|nr:hypothetical protein [Clostridiales bacterium]
MEGRMFKVSVLLDNDKILKEGKYDIRAIYYNVEKAYTDRGFIRDYDTPEGAMMFYGVNGWADNRGMMNASYFLRKQDWFMRYVRKWTGYENEQCKYKDTFGVVDILNSIKWADSVAGVI